MYKRTPTAFLITLFLVLIGQSSTRAQSSLMSVPSTDVVATKKLYLEMDYITNYASQREDAYHNFLPRAVVGVGHNVEVGANVSYTRVPGGGEPIEVQPNIKWQFHNNEGKGTAGSAGCILYAPVTHRAGADTFGLCYTVFSKQLKGNYGPRFTGGTYALVHRQDGDGAKIGAIAGYEQPLAERFSFTVDWFSGRNRFGYITPGVSLQTTHDSALSAGYAIANHGRGNNALFVYYGKQF
ncbi:MAG: hypothetical protein ABI596_16645 [Pyrinomonadaceae bacterium]